MVEKTPFAVQLSGGEPTVDTQEVEVYNEKGIECQPMGQQTGLRNPHFSKTFIKCARNFRTQRSLAEIKET